MATYKNIYYADNSTGMSNSQISYDEAVSYGDNIETVSLSIPLHVASATERDEKYPSPVDGTAVWRADLGLEQRYTTSSPAGWYTATTGMMLIRPDDFVFGGTTSGSSGTVTELGVVTFTNKNTVYVNGIFGPAFRNYKIFTNLKSTSAGANINFQFTNDGVPNSSALYSLAQYYATNAGTLTVAQSLTSTSGLLATSGATARNLLAETTLFAPFSRYPSWKTSSNSFATGSATPPWMFNQSGYFNSATAVFDGIVFFTGSADMTGSIMVYGFN
jgi:hypothetical protein